ncbi:GNAT family N-acetyltransferase [Roseicyclus elongatus]|nr:GNAT family N-acetyltransferase [Roseibacterium elongatum]
MIESSAITIARAAIPADFKAAADLTRTYFAALRTYSRDADAMVDAYLGNHDVEAELADLGGHFAPPNGACLLAASTEQPLGVVMLSRKAATHCEMNRMYVFERARGTGLGRKLCYAILEEARTMGFRRMTLETMPFLTAAISLYRSVGFTPYHGSDARFVNLQMTL